MTSGQGMYAQAQARAEVTNLLFQHLEKELKTLKKSVKKMKLGKVAPAAHKKIVKKPVLSKRVLAKVAAVVKQDEEITVGGSEKAKAKTKVAELKRTLAKLKDQVMDEATIAKTVKNGVENTNTMHITNWIH